MSKFHTLDTGPWSIGTTKDGRLYLQSADFTYDVRLYISGDFSRGQDTSYAVALCDLLNGED